MTTPTPALDGNYTAFGRVLSVLDVVQTIEAVPVDREAPTARIELIRATVDTGSK